MCGLCRSISSRDSCCVVGCAAGEGRSSQRGCSLAAACLAKGEAAAKRGGNLLGTWWPAGERNTRVAESVEDLARLDHPEAVGEGSLELLPGVGGGSCGQLHFHAAVLE